MGLAVLGIVLFVVQFSALKQLFVPWHIPVMTTLGVLLVLWSVAQRFSVVRIVALVLVLALAGFEWHFLVSIAKLPEYSGPARAGQKLPAFRTTLADGRSFTEQDLQGDKRTVMTFFRGRW